MQTKPLAIFGNDEEGVLADLLARGDPDDVIPQLARDQRAIAKIESIVQRRQSAHELIFGDARSASKLGENSIQLVVTSPPYWTLKRYNESDDQLGHVVDYDKFIEALDAVWTHCYRALVPGGRLIVNVGDVCLSRKKNNGRHTVVPLHATIQERCRAIGFDNLAPIIWHKIANANYEVSGGGGFLGKPYEPNAVIKNDIEFVLMQRKPGGYRSPTKHERLSQHHQRRELPTLVSSHLVRRSRHLDRQTPRSLPGRVRGALGSHVLVRW